MQAMNIGQVMVIVIFDHSHVTSKNLLESSLVPRPIRKIEEKGLVSNCSRMRLIAFFTPHSLFVYVCMHR